MAEQSAQHAVNEAQSMGDHLPIDVSGNYHISNDAGGVASGLVEGEVPGIQGPNASYGAETSSSTSALVNHARSSAAFRESTNLKNGSLNASSLLVDKSDSATNGDTISYDGSDDVGYQHSASGDTTHSDIEPNKSEGLEQTAEDGKNEKPGLAKRLMAFKPVSATKNFLAKAAVGTAVSAKPSNDRPVIANAGIPPIAQAAKPRLVAKSGRDARLVGTSTGLGSGGPDASKVWNRNKPTPVPPPKQFTDEELKQQYGIHLATRLQSDEAGKESKWADIDDDEDDWAPEATVEWMDGTKSTATGGDGKTIVLGPVRPQLHTELDEAGKVLTLSTQRPSSISSIGKTILRPGARTTAQTRPGLILRSVPESPAALDRTANTATSKSPWAPLPPVDKVSPITFNPPLNAPKLPAVASREASISDAGAPVTSPAREIAADDFTRAWREGDRNSRELFNSQSGRYEPVKGGRRLSRHESGFRAPALLQRPSQQGASTTAEFPGDVQNDRGSQEIGVRSWSRRKDSSGTADRDAPERASHHSSDLPEASDSPPQAPKLPDYAEMTSNTERVASSTPTLGNVPQTFTIRGSDASDASREGGAPSQDIHIIQKQVMREKLEQNRKRIQEDQAREDAARKERIRLKLEALGPVTPKETELKPTRQPQDSKLEVVGTQGEESSTVKPEMADNAGRTQPLEEPPRTQQRDREEHHPELVKVAESSPVIVAPKPNLFSKQPDVNSVLETKVANATSSSEAYHQFQVATSSQAKFPTTMSLTTPPSERLAAGKASTTPARSPVAGTQELSQDGHPLRHAQEFEVQQLPGLGTLSPADRPTQPWNSIPQSVEPMGWAGAGSLHTGNVWGVPSKERLLGNGIFEADYHLPPSIQRAPQSQPQSMNVNARFPVRTHANSFDIGQQLPSSHSLPRTEDIAQPQHWLQPHSTGPIAQFQHRAYSFGLSEQPMQQQVADQHQTAKQAWKDFSTTAARSESAAMDPRQVRADLQPTFKETFRQTTSSDILGQRQVVSVSKTIHEGHGGKTDSDNSAGQPNPGYLQPSPVQPPITSFPPPSNRPSRFFGPGVERFGVPLTLPPLLVDDGPARPASPPPPDSAEHPAFERSQHPLVHLPSPAPKVRLPPKVVSPDLQSSIVAPQDSAAVPPRYRSGPQPIVNQVAWQDRFNGLFNRTRRTVQTQAEKALSSSNVQSTPAIAATIEISSKTAFDVASDSTTVALPGIVAANMNQTSLAALPDSCIESKPGVEDLMDDREFGDTPTVYLPKINYSQIHIHNTTPSPNPHGRLVQLEDSREFTSTSHSLSLQDLDAERIVADGIRILIHFVGHDLSYKILSQKTTGHDSRMPARSMWNKKRNNAGRFSQRDSQSGTPASQSDSSDSRNPAKPHSARGGAKHNHRSGSTEDKQPLPGSAPARPTDGAATSSPGGAKPQEVKRNTWAKPPKGSRFNNTFRIPPRI